MTEQQDILTDFEEKEYVWNWHDEITFILFCLILSPFFLLAAIISIPYKLLRSKQ